LLRTALCGFANLSLHRAQNKKEGISGCFRFRPLRVFALSRFESLALLEHRPLTPLELSTETIKSLTLQEIYWITGVTLVYRNIYQGNLQLDFEITAVWRSVIEEHFGV
jgi:hypothetical protein